MLRSVFRSAAIVAVSLLAVGSLRAGITAQQRAAAPTAIDVETLGPQVGDTVPDFSLPDQHGTTRTLKSLMGPKGAVLVFFRSADW